MMKSRHSFSLEEGKIQAAVLLKSLYSADIKIAEKSAKRFQRLPEFADLSLAEILQRKIQHKHALNIIAIENKFNAWTDLKIQIHFIINGYLNPWFVNYTEAKSYLQSHGGYLLPYKNQFFICHRDYINQLGIDADDPDWKLIGYDWVKPDDKFAWQRIYQKWKE